jgi:hypothetical protein
MIWPFRKPKPPPPRRKFDVETVRMRLQQRIAGNADPHFKAVWTKQTMAEANVFDIQKASDKSFAPWRKDVWECEDQARSLIEHAQRAAANEGCSLAVGLMIADPPGQFQDAARHVYVWAVLPTGISCYDPTARRWCELPRNIYFSLA